MAVLKRATSQVHRSNLSPRPDRAKWMRERDRIYEEVMTKGWNDKRRAFTQFYGSEDLDASLLIMPLVFFMAPTDPPATRTLIRPVFSGPVDRAVHTYQGNPPRGSARNLLHDPSTGSFPHLDQGIG